MTRNADNGEGVEPVAWRPIAEHDGSDESVLAICATAYTPTAFEAWFFDGAWRVYSRGGHKQSSGVTKWFPTHWMPKPALSRPLPDAGDREDQGSSAAPIPICAEEIARAILPSVYTALDCVVSLTGGVAQDRLEYVASVLESVRDAGKARKAAERPSVGIREADEPKTLTGKDGG